jgi:hypothetical protein
MSKRNVASILLAGTISLIGIMPALGQQVCKPLLAVKDVQFSEMRPPTMERKWTAVLSVDAFRCATTSGRFAIGFSRLKETAPDMDFREQFTWQAPSVTVSVDFWADEAVEGYWLDNTAPCPCRR